jgi:predicted  nucleic acid-binding Zn-ribbon protein
LDEHDPAVAVASECSKLERELNAANDRIKRLEEALRQIANQDYRGNRSTESQIAFRALKEAKP